MSLYYEAANFLENVASGTLAARVYGSKDLRSKPTNIYALASETFKWSSILSDIIEKAEILRLERKVGSKRICATRCRTQKSLLTLSAEAHTSACSSLST